MGVCNTLSKCIGTRYMASYPKVYFQTNFVYKSVKVDNVWVYYAFCYASLKKGEFLVLIYNIYFYINVDLAYYLYQTNELFYFKL